MLFYSIEQLFMNIKIWQKVFLKKEKALFIKKFTDKWNVKHKKKYF